jgi:hypothetical protein
MTSHGVVVIACTEDSFGSAGSINTRWMPGALPHLTAGLAPAAAVHELIRAEAPAKLVRALTEQRWHIPLWSAPVGFGAGACCVAIEAVDIAVTGIPQQKFALVHIEADRDAQLIACLGELAQVHHQAAKDWLTTLPGGLVAEPRLRRAFAFAATTEDESLDRQLIHEVPAGNPAQAEHWVRGRLAFAALTLASQMANQMLLEDGPASRKKQAAVAEFRSFQEHLWWPHFTLDARSAKVATAFYARTGLIERVAEDRKSIQDIWSESEAASAKQLNRVGAVLGSSAVIASWGAAAAARPEWSWWVGLSGGAVLATAVVAFLVSHARRRKTPQR